MLIVCAVGPTSPVVNGFLEPNGTVYGSQRGWPGLCPSMSRCSHVLTDVIWVYVYGWRAAFRKPFLGFLLPLRCLTECTENVRDSVVAAATTPRPKKSRDVWRDAEYIDRVQKERERERLWERQHARETDGAAILVELLCSSSVLSLIFPFIWLSGFWPSPLDGFFIVFFPSFIHSASCCLSIVLGC